MTLKTTFITAFLFISFSTLAQEYNISGKLTDSLDNPVSYASLALSDPSDTVTIQFAVANEEGVYELKSIMPGDYLLTIACVGYEVEYKPIKLSDNIINFDMVLKSSAISMREVMVRARKIPILMNGDTIIYNRDSYKTKTNATVEDLIKKLPGIRVGKDGSLTAEGEKVAKVLINGKEFFGENVEAATKNLDADIVDKIEVIDKQKDDDEFNAVDSKKTEKVINLVLKEEYTQGYFGNVRAGYGTGDVYDVHGNINFFKDETQFSVIGGLNNISKQIYGWKELQTLNSLAVNPLNNWTYYNGGNSGVSTNEGVGANLHFEPFKKLKADVSYILTDVESIDTGLYNSEVYLDEETIFSESKSNSRSQNQNHKISSKFEFEPDTLNKLVARFQYETLVNSRNYLSQVYNFKDSLANILNSGVTGENSDKDNSKLASKIHWTRKSRKNKENKFLGSIYYGNSYVKQGEGFYFNTTDNEILKFPNRVDPIIKTNLATDEETFATTTSYTLKISKKISVEPGVNWMGSSYAHDFDWQPVGSNPLDANSPHGKVSFNDIEYYSHLIFNLDPFTTLRVVPSFNQVIEDRQFTTDKLHQFSINQFYFTPKLIFQKFKPHKYHVNSYLFSEVKRPNAYQILPVVDNTDPYATVEGNIGLNNYMSYTGSASYRKIIGFGKFVTFSSSNFYTVNPVVTKQTVDEFNYSKRELVNYKSSKRTYQTLKAQWPLKPLKASIEGSLGYDWEQSFQLQNDKELESNNSGYGVGLELQWNEFDKWSLELGADLDWNQGSIGGVKNNQFTRKDYFVEFVLNPINRLEWSTELNTKVYGANSVADAQTIPILTSSISYGLDSMQRWSIGLKAFDILDENQNLMRYWDANRFVQSQNIAIQRYVMFTIRYKIKQPKPNNPANNGEVIIMH